MTRYFYILVVALTIFGTGKEILASMDDSVAVKIKEENEEFVEYVQTNVVNNGNNKISNPGHGNEHGDDPPPGWCNNGKADC